MRIGVLSDTHAPRFWSGCPAPVAAAFAGVELILHAGDVCLPEVLDELGEIAPVRAVLGNNDPPAVAAWGAPQRLELAVDGVRIAMVHDSGPAPGRGPRLRRWFPGADLVVFGHSHIPWDEIDGGQRQVNPGSPTDRRRQPRGTVAVIELARGRVRDVTLVPVSR